MLVIARVDDRLIHGQVATSWIKENNIQVVVVVDEDLPKDAIQQQVLKMAAPPGVKVYAMEPEKFVEKDKLGVLNAYRVMLIFANVHTPLKLVQCGFKLESLNIGGVRYREGRKQINKTISLTPDECEMLRQLAKLGVKLEHRQLYSDSKVDILSLI